MSGYVCRDAGSICLCMVGDLALLAPDNKSGACLAPALKRHARTSWLCLPGHPALLHGPDSSPLTTNQARAHCSRLVNDSTVMKNASKQLRHHPHWHTCRAELVGAPDKSVFAA